MVEGKYRLKHGEIGKIDVCMGFWLFPLMREMPCIFSLSFCSDGLLFFGPHFESLSIPDFLLTRLFHPCFFPPLVSEGALCFFLLREIFYLSPRNKRGSIY